MRVRLAIGSAAVLLAAALGLGAWWASRPERHLGEAERRLLGDRPDAALDWLEVPEATPRTRDRALLLRARVALARGRPAEAVEPLNRVDASGRWAADAAFWKARTLYAARQTVRAIAWFREAATLRPDDPDIHRWLAAAAYDLGARDHALAELAVVLRLRPDDPRAWRTTGLIHRENAQHAEARRAYERALALDAAQPDVRLELAATLVKLGEHAEADRQLERCRGATAPAGWTEVLAECRLAQGDLPGSRAALDAALADAPAHPGLLALRARLDLREGRAAEAVAGFERALAVDPYDNVWHYQRGLALQRLGRAAEADAALARAAELREAITEMSRLNDEAARRPFDADIRCRIGALCVRLGKAEVAESWYLAALACDPSHAEARRGLAALSPSAPGRRYSALP